MNPRKSCLILNADMSPIKVCSRQRAVKLVFSGKAEVVAERDGHILHSEDFEMRDPAVIVLRKRANVPYRRAPAPTRRSILVRDNYVCAYCGSHADTIDHVIPTSKGGKHEYWNLVACCRKDNAEKGNKTLKEMGWDIDFVPKAPGNRFWVALATKNEIDPLWLPFL